MLSVVFLLNQTQGCNFKLFKDIFILLEDRLVTECMVFKGTKLNSQAF